VFDDRRQIVEPRLPSERAQAAIICNQGNPIPDPSLGDAFFSIFVPVTPSMARERLVSKYNERWRRNGVKQGAP
jgi:hypothetical protein